MNSIYLNDFYDAADQATDKLQKTGYKGAYICFDRLTYYSADCDDAYSYYSIFFRCALNSAGEGQIILQLDVNTDRMVYANELSCVLMALALEKLSETAVY